MMAFFFEVVHGKSAPLTPDSKNKKNCLRQFILFLESGVSFAEINITNVTFELFLSFKNCCNMLIQFALLAKVGITNVTFELFLSFMECYNMFFQSTLLSKFSIAYVTLELFFLFHGLLKNVYSNRPFVQS